MKHLILGSEGQIGGHLLQYLKSVDEEVIEFDIIRTDSEDLRIHDNPLLHDCVDDCDIVHFLAFDVGGSAYMKKYQNTYEFISNNIKIMNTVFDTLKKTGKPFLFATSQMSNMNYSTYGLLKAMGEAFTKSLGGVIIKFWNVYGYEKDPEKTHVITDFIIKARNEGKISMRTDGSEVRQFLYGDDCAKCILLLSRIYTDIDRSKPLDITNFEWTSIMEVANIISGEFADCQVYPADAKDDLQQDKRNEPDPYILNFWKPETPVREGIKKIIGLMS